jgi:acetyl-CoA synthetase
MPKLTEYTRYADALKFADSGAPWELFDGNREHLNIAHECVSRHADGSGRTAVRIAHADGTDEVLSFDEIAAGSSRFAHWLVENGIQPGDRIAFMLEPSLPFYLSLFGAMMMGAISVPLFTLFGLDGLKLRVDDCKPWPRLSAFPRQRYLKITKQVRHPLSTIVHLLVFVEPKTLQVLEQLPYDLG